MPALTNSRQPEESCPALASSRDVCCSHCSSPSIPTDARQGTCLNSWRHNVIRLIWDSDKYTHNNPELNMLKILKPSKNALKHHAVSTVLTFQNLGCSLPQSVSKWASDICYNHQLSRRHLLLWFCFLDLSHCRVLITCLFRRCIFHFIFKINNQIHLKHELVLTSLLWAASNCNIMFKCFLLVVFPTTWNLCRTCQWEFPVSQTVNFFLLND